MFGDDDLSAWNDDPVVRALTGPASGDELAGEAEALAGFRAAVPVRSRRRYLGRLGVGGSALGIAVALSGGVAAAAYTSSLPTGVQRAAHDAVQPWAPWAAPPLPSAQISLAAEGRRIHHPLSSPTTPAPVVTPTAPLANPSAPVGGARPSPLTKPLPVVAHHPSAAAKPDPKPSPPVSVPPVAPTSPVVTPTQPTTPTPPPTSPPAPVPSVITITVSSTRVAVGSSVSVTGQLDTATGDPVPGAVLAVMERTPGETGVTQVGQTTTASDGSAGFALADLTHTVRLRLSAGGGVSSALVTVVVVPTVSVAVTGNGPTTTASVSTVGGNPGDSLMLQERINGRWAAGVTTQLDASGGASFVLPTPPTTKVRYRVILPRTNQHAYTLVGFVVPPA